MLTDELYASKTLKKAKMEDDKSTMHEEQSPTVLPHSEVNTSASDKVSEANIKYVNVLYNTKPTQRGISEGPTMVENEVSIFSHFATVSLYPNHFVQYIGPDHNT